MNRRILLADADQFYVAVARLADPDGAGRAPLLIVGGSPRGRGVVTSASYEARAFGVHSAMPMARAVRLCPGAMVVPVPWKLCAVKSREIRSVLERFSPIVEAASSDEYYLDLAGTERLYGGEPLRETAVRIRRAVLDETGLSLSIGGGTSKLVAKLAATSAKPGGVRVVEPGEEPSFMEGFALADLPFVGPRFQERLLRFNLKRVSDAKAAGRDRLVQWLGERQGRWLWDRIHGRDRSRVEPRGEPGSISRDETFAFDVNDDAQLVAELLRLVERAGTDLRERGLLVRTVSVRIRDQDFKDRQASRTLAEPVSSDRAIARVARDLLARLRRARRVPERLIGVALSQLVRRYEPVQFPLIEPQCDPPALETGKDRAVALAVDTVRRRLGREAVVLGRLPRRRDRPDGEPTSRQ